MIILQIAPVIGVGTGVGAVAYHLEQEWLRLGHDVRRLELKDTGAGWLARPGSGVPGKLKLLAGVVWFSTVGTVVARRRIAELPAGSVSICHNDALAGDLYVNHGLLQTSLAARGRRRLRLLRNPLHLFTTARDRWRYRSSLHRAVVNLTAADDRALRQVYPRLHPPTWVIGNGVDVTRFRPPTPAERQEQRDALGLSDDDVVTVFVGHEFARKGLAPLLEAIAGLDARHHLVVVGGDPPMVESLRRRAQQLGCEHRCHAVGVQDPLPSLWAADVLAQPSAYESYGLVVVEALAAGLPVISTPVGVAPEVVVEGRTGFLTDATPEDLARCLRLVAAGDRGALSDASRRLAESHAWPRVAADYLARLAVLARGKEPPASQSAASAGS